MRPVNADLHPLDSGASVAVADSPDPRDVLVRLLPQSLELFDELDACVVGFHILLSSFPSARFALAFAAAAFLAESDRDCLPLGSAGMHQFADVLRHRFPAGSRFKRHAAPSASYAYAGAFSAAEDFACGPALRLTWLARGSL